MEQGEHRHCGVRVGKQRDATIPSQTQEGTGVRDPIHVRKLKLLKEQLIKIAWGLC